VENKKLLTDFVPFPRQILSARKNGELTPNEYDLYMFVRHGGSPYGVSSVSLEGLEADFSHRRWTKNYINKLLLSLKSKRFLSYPERKGRRGSFEIRLPQFATPTGGITTARIDPPADRVRGYELLSSEARPKSVSESPNLNHRDSSGLKRISEFRLEDVRTSYIETDTKNRDNRYPNQPPKSFIPSNYQEERCKEIALELGESSMSFLLGALRQHGFALVEQAWGRFSHDLTNKSDIRNKGAYFNTIVQKLAEEKRDEKSV
jgi:hypothetical protein